MNKLLINIILTIALLIIIVSCLRSVYASIEDPITFGNATAVTCSIGGGKGNLTCIGDVTGRNFYGNGSALSGITVAESDPRWSANFTNMQTDCVASNYAYGIYGNGSYKCRADVSGGGGTLSYTNLMWKNETGQIIVGTQIFNVLQAQNWANVSITESQISNFGSYLKISQLNGNYPNSTQINASYTINTSLTQYVSWGKLNATIDQREVDTNTTTACGGGTNQVLLSNGSCYQIIGRQWITPGDVIDIDDEDIETDLNTYVDIAGDVMTAALDLVNWLNISRFVTDASSAPQLILAKARGTSASPVEINANDILGEILFKGYSGDSSSQELGARIRSTATGTPGQANDMGANLSFETSPDNSQTPVSRMVIGSNGNITVADSLTALGLYENGARVLKNLLEDASPQLGGYLDTNGNAIGATTDEIENVYVTTNYHIYFGDGQESNIMYNGSSLIIEVS